jgi:hypothetical protein
MYLILYIIYDIKASIKKPYNLGKYNKNIMYTYIYCTTIALASK